MSIIDFLYTLMVEMYTKRSILYTFELFLMKRKILSGFQYQVFVFLFLQTIQDPYSIL